MHAKGAEALFLAQMDTVTDAQYGRWINVLGGTDGRSCLSCPRPPGEGGRVRALRDRDGGAEEKAQAGCTHATAGKTRWSDQPEFVVITQWRSVDALQAFAGPDWQEAVIEPEEKHMLAEVFCDHYETIETG